MNHRQTWTILGVMAIVAVSVGISRLWGQPGGSAARPITAAVVDVQAVFAKLDEKAAIEADITGQTEKLQNEGRNRQAQLKEIEADIKVTNVNSPTFKQLTEKLEKLVLEYQVWEKWSKRQLEVEKTLRIEQLYLKLVKAIGDMAKKNGYDLVLYKDQTGNFRSRSQQQAAAVIQLRKVLYSNEKLDISSALTKQLNNEYKAKKK